MKRICVYCGAKSGLHPHYQQAATQLADALVKQGLGLVYGGGSIGLMGQIADSVLAAGGQVIGVIPQALAQEEVMHAGLSELKLVDDMHQRKALMMDLADGFIALPGGFGTLEELFEVLAWAQLGFHQKPCAVLNVHGYYNALTAFLQHTLDEGFLKKRHHELLIVEDNPTRLLQRMALNG